jgi:hypothetical protein
MPATGMVITALWEINQYTITFNTHGGTTIDPITQDYDTAITPPANPTRTGYTFDSWDQAIPATMPAENMTIGALWNPNPDTPYKVEHYKQNINDDNYPSVPTEVDNLQ